MTDLVANKAVSQSFHALNDDEKDTKLWKILEADVDYEKGDKVIVFCNTKKRIEKLASCIKQEGFTCAVMSGDKTQQEREQGLKDFELGKSGPRQCQLMIATDVCSRGLDIKGVTHVINYDMARDVESYIHRIGRTGRGGPDTAFAKGVSITFVNEDYDVPCSPALAQIAAEAGQEVPPFLKKLVEKASRPGACAKNKQWIYKG